MEFVGKYEICKGWNLQGMEFVRKPSCNLQINVTISHTVNVGLNNLKINVQTFDIISLFKNCKSYCCLIIKNIRQFSGYS